MTLRFRNQFPKNWNEERISRCISQIVDDPDIARVPITGGKDWIPHHRRKVVLDSYCCGLNIRVVLEPKGRGVLAAYPYTPE